MKKILSILLAVLVLAGMLTIGASAADVIKGARIGVGTKDAQGNPQTLYLTMDEGDAPKYLVTDEDGFAYESGATEQNYNIKFECKDGMATVYLKGANLKNDRSNGLQIGTGKVAAINDTTTHNTFPCTVVVESDSTVEAGSYIGANGKVVTNQQGLVFACSGPNLITGPGKLTVKCEYLYAINGAAGDLTFKDAKVELIRGYGTDGVSAYPTLWMAKDGASNLTFDNSEVKITNLKGCAIVCSTNNTKNEGADTGDIIVKNGSKLSVTNAESARPCITTTTGEFKIDNAEVTISSYSLPFSPKPIMTGVGAVAGTKESNAKPYSEKKVSGYTYFHCGPDVKVEEVTTPPTTTVPPTTQQQVPPTTQQQVPPTTQQQTPPTAQQQTPPTTNAAPNATEPVDTDTGSGNGATILVIVLVAFAVLGIGAAVAVVIINKKKGNI